MSKNLFSSNLLKKIGDFRMIEDKNIDTDSISLSSSKCTELSRKLNEVLDGDQIHEISKNLHLSKPFNKIRINIMEKSALYNIAYVKALLVMGLNEIKIRELISKHDKEYNPVQMASIISYANELTIEEVLDNFIILQSFIIDFIEGTVTVTVSRTSIPNIYIIPGLYEGRTPMESINVSFPERCYYLGEGSIYDFHKFCWDEHVTRKSLNEMAGSDIGIFQRSLFSDVKNVYNDRLFFNGIFRSVIVDSFKVLLCCIYLQQFDIIHEPEVVTVFDNRHKKRRDNSPKSKGQVHTRRTSVIKRRKIKYLNPNEVVDKDSRIYNVSSWNVRGHWRTYKNGKKVWIKAQVRKPKNSRGGGVVSKDYVIGQ